MGSLISFDNKVKLKEMEKDKRNGGDNEDNDKDGEEGLACQEASMSSSCKESLNQVKSNLKYCKRNLTKSVSAKDECDEDCLNSISSRSMDNDVVNSEDDTNNTSVSREGRSEEEMQVLIESMMANLVDEAIKDMACQLERSPNMSGDAGRCNLGMLDKAYLDESIALSNAKISND
eukprot:CAMPEP_0172519202 /NCGR_PEP_ID=MMETSP1066-20121228/291276_1 /TAXON_ID=671091 /ORGANISM="Coscinodiscus wailesii, Strain CCMP2513" /LENGTH=175 /DNA_ID=CAMNT_0013301741 /DNA_START=909 /DNA_END=1436 /DNA_ORIENTATION=-